jgi:hypothetical protein
MATLETVGDYLTEARVLLQDTRVPYRYPDADIIRALSIGMQEAYRLRADLFLSALDFKVPDLVNTTDPVPIEVGYRQGFVYYMVGRIQLRDQEDTTDQRAGALLQKFVGQMLTIAS